MKLALLACLAAWLPRCPEVPPAVSAQLAAGLAEPKESLRRGNLRAALAAVRAAPQLAGGLGPLAPPLAKLVADGVAKAAGRADGLAALLLAAHVAAADASAGTRRRLGEGLPAHAITHPVLALPGSCACCTAAHAHAYASPLPTCLVCTLRQRTRRPDAALDKAGVWGAPLAHDSPLLSSATLAKLAPADAVPGGELGALLLSKHGARLQGGACLAWAAMLLWLQMGCCVLAA